jgi:hypothetical protein
MCIGNIKGHVCLFIVHMHVTVRTQEVLIQNKLKLKLKLCCLSLITVMSCILIIF